MAPHLVCVGSTVKRDMCAGFVRVVLGARLLQETLEACSKSPDCEEIYLHVQVGNDAALDFYKGFGFEVGEVVKDYYTRLDVNDAHKVRKLPPFDSAALLKGAAGEPEPTKATPRTGNY